VSRDEQPGDGARPTVGVIIAARNAVSTVADSVRSVIEQSVPPAHVVVVDDGSTDGTAEAVEQLRPDGVRLDVVRIAHQGRSTARNLAIDRLTTDLVAVQDADDIALPWRFEQALATFDEHPAAVAVGAQMLAFERPGFAWEMPRWPVEPADIARTFASGRMGVAHPTLVVRRDALVAAGGYDPSFAYAEDLVLLQRIIADGEIASSDRTVTLYRKPRRYGFGHMRRTELATRRARTPELGLVQHLAVLAAVERVWLRQRIKPLPPERPLSTFGIAESLGAHP
jgi:glycosyltransferase involved in cell wall biosynthesis